MSQRKSIFESQKEMDNFTKDAHLVLNQDEIMQLMQSKDNSAFVKTTESIILKLQDRMKRSKSVIRILVLAKEKFQKSKDDKKDNK